jgi:hypothetical protein
MMERKEIAAFLIGCKASEFMGYADKGDEGCVVIGPDGKKYRFSADYLAQAKPKAEPAKPAKPKKRAPTKRSTKSQTTTKKKAAPKTSSKSKQ